MITLLYKYPWYAVDHVTVVERRNIYDCATILVQNLVKALRRANNKYEALAPSPALLQELSVAILGCPGFSEKQKSIIYAHLVSGGYKGLAEGHGINVTLGGNNEFSSFWPFSALSITPGAHMELVRYYASLFRQATVNVEPLSLAARQATQASGQSNNPMGDFKIKYGQNASQLSLADLAKKEWDKIEELLSMVCGRDPVSVSAPASLNLGLYGSSDGSGSRQGSANSGFGLNPTHRSI